MRRIVLLLTLSMTLAITQLAVAGPFIKCTEYKSGDKIDHSRVSCYQQDSKGMLWLGTWIGLCRYDGKEFRFFSYSPNEVQSADNLPLGSNRIVRMTLDSRENIWCINYDRNLYRFDRKTTSFEAVLSRVKEAVPSPVWVDEIYAMSRNHAIWAVLKDGTLIRFNDADPSDYVIIPSTSGLKDRHVYQISEDGKGREWILSDQGVMMYGCGVLSNTPYSHFAEKDGYCILATQDGIVSEYMEDGTFRSIELPIKIQHVSYVKKQLYSDIAISTDAGLVIYSCQTRKVRSVVKTKTGQPVRNVKQVYLDTKERLWFYADGDGIYCLTPGDSVAYLLSNPNPGKKLNNEAQDLNLFFEDVHNFIWVKPTQGELCYMDEETFSLRNYKEFYHKGEPLPFTDYNVTFLDSQRNLWVSSGTRMYQLYFGLKQFHELECDPGVEIRSLLAEDDSHVLCGDREGRIFRLDIETGQRRYLTAEGRWSDKPVRLYSNGVYAMKRDSQGRIWVGTRNDGLSIMRAVGNDYKIERYTRGDKDYDINCDAVYDFYEDECSRIWIATFGGGINLVDEQPDGKIRFLNATNQLFNYPVGFDYVRSIVGDGQGRIFAGTNRGLVAFSSNFNALSNIDYHIYQTQTQQENPLPDNMIMKVFCDAEGTFYVCTFSRGMCRVMGEGVSDLQFESHFNRNFTAGNVIYSGFAAKSGRVWTVSECGLTCFNIQNGKQWYFNEHDNNVFYALTECTPIELPDNRVLIGMNGGVIIFQEDALRKSHFAPKIVFTEREYTVGYHLYSELINDLDTLIIKPEHRTSNLHFASLDLVPSPFVRYAYSVQGEDDSSPRWFRTSDPMINFMNMSPGKYHLRVRSCNSDVVWCDNSRSLVVIIEPTFWERWLMLIIVLVAISIIAPVGWTHIHKRLRRAEEAAKKEIATAKIEMLSRPIDRADQEFVQRLMQLLDERLSDGNMQVNDIADEMNMSRATFYRRLKQAVDLSPNDFIHQVRMKRSAELLTDTDQPIAQIAYAVGFNNPKYFSKCFRLDFGMSPLDYRAKMRQ